MRAHGTDRLRIAGDGSIELSARLAKREWHARTEKTATRGERPGTAVIWDDECYEVVTAVPLPQGVRYTLRPWTEGEAMRVTTTYDDATESARDAERRDLIRREKQRRIATWLAFFTGQLPGPVQERLAHELNVDAPMLTMWSALPPWLAVAATILVDATRMLHEEPRLPVWWHVIAGWLFLETSARFKMAWLDRRPSGSLAGVIGYAIYSAVTPRRAPAGAPAVANKPAVAAINLSAEEELRGVLHTREPLLTLLDTRDQERLRERFGFDYLRTARGMAAFILVVAIVGVVSSIRTLSITPRFSAATSLIAAALIAAEQLWRLTQLPNRPVPSFLRFVLRPLAKSLLN